MIKFISEKSALGLDEEGWKEYNWGKGNHLEAIAIIRQEVKVVSTEGVAAGTREVGGVKRDQEVVP